MDKTEYFTNQLNFIMDKSKCYDIFQFLQIKNMEMYQRRTIKDILFYSIEMKKLTRELKKI